MRRAVAKFYIGGQLWRLYVVPARSPHLTSRKGPRIERFAGRCVFSKCAIYVSANQSPEAREDTFVHELCHACLGVSGADSAYGGSAELEEQMVTSLAPILHRLLKDLGFVFPEGLYI